MKRRISLSGQLILTMVLLVAGTVGLCSICSFFFLATYYSYNKQSELKKVYELIDTAYRDGSIKSEDFVETLRHECLTDNINYFVWDYETYDEESSDFSFFVTADEETENFVNSVILSSFNEKQLISVRNSLIWHNNIGYVSDDILINQQNYSIVKQKNGMNSQENMILQGQCIGDEDTSNDSIIGQYDSENNVKYVIYLQTPFESIKESARITSRFFTAIGVGAIFISAAVIIILSRNISKPISELTDISKRMSNLEFDAKYKPGKHTAEEIVALGNHINELSQALEENISDLKVANNELKVDIEKKEQIDEMRKEFLSNVSHELKTPLALIQGYAEGLIDGITDDPESMNYYCEVIVDEAEKMNKMVKQLLSLNQLEFGNELVEMERFDLTELTNAVINSNSLRALQKSITIDFVENTEAFVWGDEFKVEEVITNFISNAINHADGDKNIRVYYEKRGDLLRLNVHNTGENIPEDDLDKVWIKFYKVDKARTREYGGSGIGLSIVKAIMDSFHRDCGVYNTEDGVTFWMELDTKN